MTSCLAAGPQEVFLCPPQALPAPPPRLWPQGMLMDGKVILNADEMRRAITRMAHEIVEQNAGPQGLVVVGLCTRGVPLAQRIAQAITAFEGTEVPCGQLDITLY